MKVAVIFLVIKSTIILQNVIYCILIKSAQVDAMNICLYYGKLPKAACTSIQIFASLHPCDSIVMSTLRSS